MSDSCTPIDSVLDPQQANKTVWGKWECNNHAGCSSLSINLKEQTSDVLCLIDHISDEIEKDRLYMIFGFVCVYRFVRALFACFWFLLGVLCIWQGTVVALDKIRSKVEKINENANALRLHCIKAHCYNSIHAVCSELTHDRSTGTDQITFVKLW